MTAKGGERVGVGRRVGPKGCRGACLLGNSHLSVELGVSASGLGICWLDADLGCGCRCGYDVGGAFRTACPVVLGSVLWFQILGRQGVTRVGKEVQVDGG